MAERPFGSPWYLCGFAQVIEEALVGQLEALLASIGRDRWTWSSNLMFTWMYVNWNQLDIIYHIPAPPVVPKRIPLRSDDRRAEPLAPAKPLVVRAVRYDAAVGRDLGSHITGSPRKVVKGPELGPTYGSFNLSRVLITSLKDPYLWDLIGSLPMGWSIGSFNLCWRLRGVDLSISR